MDALARLGLRPLQVAWFALALLAAAAGSDALADRSTSVRVLAAVLAYGGWAVGLGALLVPRSTSLTVARLLVPAGAVGAIAAAATQDAVAVVDLAAAIVASACVVLLLAPWSTDAFVDGSSYGPERRFALRTPAPVALLAVPVWAVAVAGALAGPVLLAASAWLSGVLAVAVGWPAAFFAARSLHTLARRWIVLVPAGLVVHDPLTMPEAQLFLRQTMRRLGPAAAPDADDDLATEDLTGGASGLALALEVTEPVDLLVRAAGEGEIHAVDRVLFTPGRPAALLDGARAHRLPVG